MSKRLGFKTEAQGWKLVTEPPVTCTMDLGSIRDKPLVLHFPAHSQAVEHAVKNTSEAVKTTTSYEAQLGQAFATTDSRKKTEGQNCKEAPIGSGQSCDTQEQKTVINQ